eukprot:jgi/Hompol1/3700/HPOL_000835-RA
MLAVTIASVLGVLVALLIVPVPRGAIVAFDLKTETATHLSFPPSFNGLAPAGLGILADPTDASTLIIHVINNHGSHPTIEIFTHKLGSTELTHIESVQHKELLPNPLDIHPTSLHDFYVTNGLPNPTSGIHSAINLLYRTESGSIVHRINSTWRASTSRRFQLPNGIAMSSDLQTVYVVSSVAPRLDIFSRRASGTIKAETSVALAMIADKVSVGNQGEVYVTGHLNAVGLVRHALDHDIASPSQVVKISIKEGDVYYGDRFKIETVLSDDGVRMPAASIYVADAATRKSVIGGIYLKGIYICRA